MTSFAPKVPAPVTQPAATVPAVDTTQHPAPSSLSVPSLHDASATASASLDQVASYVGMLQGALKDDPAFYERLVKRGFLDSAIDYAKYAFAVIQYDQAGDNDGFKGIIDGAIIGALESAQNMGIPTVSEPNLLDELSMAGAAATNAARGLQTLVARPVGE